MSADELNPHQLDLQGRRKQGAGRSRPLFREASDAVERGRVEREAHAPLGAELVDQERVRRALDVLEEECRRPTCLDGPIGE
jgi:hypothetical protein